MFSPEGFIGFDSLRSHLEMWANQTHYAYLLESIGLDPSLAFSSDQGSYDATHFRMVQFKKNTPMADVSRETDRWREFSAICAEDQFHYAVIYHCMFAKCLMKLDTLLTSPHGNVMRPDDYLFIHMDRLDWIFPNWPVNETTELRHIFELYGNSKFAGHTFGDRYCFLDLSLGVLKLKNNSISGFKTCSHFGSEEFANLYVETHVKPFLGWAPVWDEEHLPNDMSQFLEDLGVLEERWNVPSLFVNSETKPTQVKKRGPKPGPAKALFDLEYPYGIPEERSAEYVAAEFAAKGVTISPRQIANYDVAFRSLKQLE
jgi:hypothetical protein